MATQRKRTSPKRPTRKATAPRSKSGKDSEAGQSTSRQTKVVGALILGLAATTGLLWFLSPGPLLPEASRRLFATTATPRTLHLEGAAFSDVEPVYRAVFDTPVPVQAGRWQEIRVFQSGTAGGDAGTVAGDAGHGAHFVVCNGIGAGDGEVQITQAWDQQLTAEAGADRGVIRICVIGRDSRMTPNQQTRLQGIVEALRE